MRSTYTTKRLESFARRLGIEWGIAHDPGNRSPYYVVSEGGEPLSHGIGLGATREHAEWAIEAEAERRLGLLEDEDKPRRGRPPVADKRTHRVKMNDAEWAHCVAQAEADGVSAAAWVRARCGL